MVGPMFRSVRATHGGIIITANRPMRDFLRRLVEERLAAVTQEAPPATEGPDDRHVLVALATGLRRPAEPAAHALGG